MKTLPTILTLDAGGTNLVFSALKNDQEIADTITLPTHADDLPACLDNIIRGFTNLKDQVGFFDAISFGFPGPADYPQGIIGKLPNFPAFDRPVPLKHILQKEFNVPVYINNDANLFAAGEARSGYLPELNRSLKEMGSSREYHNLIGITLGTGFGCGIVIDGQMMIGDNSSGAEIHNTINKYHPAWNAEESVSTRAIIREYRNHCGSDPGPQTPESICRIACGQTVGNQEAALQSFELFGQALGASLVNIVTLVDGITVIGGGLTGAWDLFAGAMFREINRPYESASGQTQDRLSFRLFNLEDPQEMATFAAGDPIPVRVPDTSLVLHYDRLPRSGVARSKHGVSRSTALGAYAFALRQLNRSV